MKKLSFYILSHLLILTFSTSIFAQDFQGVAFYQTKTTMDMDGWGGGRQLSEQQKKQIADRMKSFLEKTYVLTFSKTESIYKEEERLGAPGSGGGWGSMMGNSFSAGPQYKNVKDKQFLQDQEFFGKQFLIKEELKTLEWKMGSETKQIGKYTCYKATATKTVDEFDWRSMRRRDRGKDKKKDSTDKASEDKEAGIMDEIEVPKTIEVVAWYTPEIPINQGPADFWGLPGLILEVNADRTTILCSKIVMNPDEKEEIEAPDKGEEVTKKEYAEIITKKMEEMRSMYRGRGRGGSRRN
ncbi:GLPGLI family protein [Ichthyenterobacterium sp. W332]|uniref:GLPGLI family protein n=1 Tax=Microcosmobacter mediterraneus TaxID=3075607 RepID=A0ABU2YLI9_9FLAO|nr:GLPGLI family protein [Ichthyenterobacterium sp. W332]MDT0559011.1 GLPGLI family protein [Ichthyenterobacterium sp. W332]